MSQKRHFESKIIECSCGAGEAFLRIHLEDWDGLIKEADEIERDWFAEVIIVGRNWKDRLKMAWRLLQGREAHYGEVLLDTVDIKDLHDLSGEWLKSYAKYHDKEQAHLLED